MHIHAVAGDIQCSAAGDGKGVGRQERGVGHSSAGGRCQADGAVRQDAEAGEVVRVSSMDAGSITAEGQPKPPRNCRCGPTVRNRLAVPLVDGSLGMA